MTARYAWIAKLARIGVASQEYKPRLIAPAATLYLAPTNGVAPLTDPQTRLVGSVFSIHLTDHWLYAFGLVGDDEVADRMRSGVLAPEFALTRATTRPPDDGPLTITGGEIAAVRAAVNPRIRPGQPALWSGCHFTVEDRS